MCSKPRGHANEIEGLALIDVNGRYTPLKKDMCNKKSNGRPHIVAWLLVVVFAGVFCYAGFRLGSELWAAQREKRAFEALASRLKPVERSPETPSQGPVGMHNNAAAEPSAPKPTVAPPDYSEFYAMNADFFGWLTIDDTNINYPVVYAPDKPDYYLAHAFDGTASKSGVPYIDENCRPDSKLVLIHGHHMKDKSMFGQLPEYANREFWEAHPVVHFNTMDAWGDYRIIAAFLADANPSARVDAFRYYEYVDLDEKQLFDYYITQVKAASLYDTGIDAVYGDSLLVLSTCNYHTSNGRFVVVAKRIV